VVQTANRDEDGRNPARGRPGLAGKGPRRGLGLPSVPFEAVQRSEEVPDGVLGGSVVLKTASAPAPVNRAVVLGHVLLGMLQRGYMEAVEGVVPGGAPCGGAALGEQRRLCSACTGYGGAKYGE
jgi:hypothetical protein